MKILVFIPAEGASAQVCDVQLYPASSMIKTNRALFLPELGAMSIRAALVARLGRMGKRIAPRFAMRYVDAVTAGFVLTPVEAVIDPTVRCFDGALPCGVMTTHDFESQGEPAMAWSNGDQQWTQLSRPAGQWLSEVIASASRHMTLNTGDMLYLASEQAQPVNCGDVLHGSYEGTNVLTIRVK